MNTCPDCKNDLVCHDQGECLRPTPETDAETAHKNDVYEFVDPEWDWVVPADFARRLERQLAEARQAFAIATSQLVQAQGELRQAREENVRLRDALQANLFHHALACVWQHQDGTFGDKTRITEDSCKCPPKVKAFRKLLGTNSENKGFDP